jgi:flagellar biosynthesis regulator FlaF
VLSDDTISAFRAVLREHCGDVAGSRAEIDAAVSSVAAEARGNGMSAAQFVIWIKHVWDDIADDGGLAEDPDPVRTRDTVISLAIRAYYVQ